jgi:hypothetical protein
MLAASPPFSPPASRSPPAPDQVLVTLDTLADWPPTLGEVVEEAPPEAARPTGAARPGLPPSVMRRCLLLAALLHVWLVLLIGNVPPGSALPGTGVGGTLNVRLAGDRPGLPAQAGFARTAPAQVAGAADAVPPTREVREGGRVRDQAPAPDAAPGAARQGDWAPAAPVLAAPDLLPAARAPLPAAAPEQPASPPPLPGRVLDADAVMAKPAPAPQAPLSSSPLSGAPATLPTLATPSAPPAAVLQAPVLALPAAPQLAGRPAPSAALPLSTQAPAIAPTTLPALPKVVVPDRVLPAAAPLAAPAPASPALQTAAEPLAPLDVPAALPSSAVPAAAAAPAGAPPQGIDRPGSAASQTPELRPAISSPLPGGMGRGAPDAGERVGHDIATPPAAAASAPRLNLELPRTRGGELSGQGSRGVLQLLPRPPEVKSKLATDIEKAGKADCTKAYAGAGLLAVVPLAVDALKKDSGCKW